MNYLSPSADPFDSVESRRLFFAPSLLRSLNEQITECTTRSDECTLESHDQDQMTFVSKSHLVPGPALREAFALPRRTPPRSIIHEYSLVVALSRAYFFPFFHPRFKGSSGNLIFSDGRSNDDEHKEKRNISLGFELNFSLNIHSNYAASIFQFRAVRYTHENAFFPREKRNGNERKTNAMRPRDKSLRPELLRGV